MKIEYDAIILAAGLSTRMKRWKMTLPFQGSTVIERSVENALAACKRVILVGGYRIKDLTAIFQSNESVKIVYNADYKKGMFTSIKKAIPHVKTERFFISLGDMPNIAPGVYEELGGYKDIDVVIPTYRGKKGHPVFLSKRVGERILEYDDKSTMREVLAEFLNLLVPVESESILKDIDTEEDYADILEEKD